MRELLRRMTSSPAAQAAAPPARRIRKRSRRGLRLSGRSCGSATRAAPSSGRLRADQVEQRRRRASPRRAGPARRRAGACPARLAREGDFALGDERVERHRERAGEREDQRVVALSPVLHERHVAAGAGAGGRHEFARSADVSAARAS